jgi:hypothetical protein
MADIMGPGGESTAPLSPRRGTMDEEVAQLVKLPREIGTRHIGWRIIDAFAHDKVGELVFWSLVCARFHAWEGDQELFAEMMRFLATNGGSLLL